MSVSFQLISILFFLYLTLADSVNESAKGICGVNERYRVVNGREPTCSPEPFGPIHGTKPFCACKIGYVRHNDKCIRPQQCPKCKPNEIYIYCTPKPCVSGCVCKPGYIKDNYGNCVKMCTRPNEEFSTCIPLCPEMCRLTNGVHITCPPPFPPDLSCKPGCQCKKGYVRGGGGVCILAYDCPPFLCTEPDEEYSKCGDPFPRTCATVGITNTGPPAPCYPACVCKTGLVKDANNKCINPSLC